MAEGRGGAGWSVAALITAIAVLLGGATLSVLTALTFHGDPRPTSGVPLLIATIAMCVLGGVAAIVLGAVAASRRAEPGRQGRRGLAILAIVIGALAAPIGLGVNFATYAVLAVVAPTI